MTDITIRPYKEEDFESLGKVHDEARKNELDFANLSEAFLPFNIASKKEGLFDYNIYVAEYKENIAGFIAFNKEEIAWVYVDTNYPRKGIGKKLLEFALEKVNINAEIEVLSENKPAINLYKSFGFKIIETLKGKMPGNENFKVTVHVMNRVEIKKLRNYPDLKEKAAKWFSDKWDVPVEEYEKSIEFCISGKIEIPQWYVMVDDKENIVAGTGVIENDFHDRKDLSPNLCALFVEEKYRKQGIAGELLDFVKEDMKEIGVKKLYLITDHTEFYEKYGWSFLTMVNGDDGTKERMYEVDTNI